MKHRQTCRGRERIYVRIGDRIYMVTPTDTKGETFLSATVTNEGLLVDQLEPERGACTS